MKYTSFHKLYVFFAHQVSPMDRVITPSKNVSRLSEILLIQP